jgi:hypothetical protein
MATETNDTRALTAALEAATPFRTLVGTGALHAAERHVDRWAPETGAVGRSRSLRSLAFVDRLVSPWVTAAQQSASLRMYGEYVASGMPSRTNASAVSWVFPRPWYQDELDWMAAARQVAASRPREAEGALTTRGTYVADPAQLPAMSMSAMTAEPRIANAYAGPMEMVAPALSLGRTPSFQVSPEGRATGAAREIGLSAALPMAAPLATWSPLVPFAAAQAAQVFAAAISAAVETGLAEQSPMLSAFALVSPADLVSTATREIADAQAAGLPVTAGGVVIPQAGARPVSGQLAPTSTNRALGGLTAGVLQAQLAATLQQIESIRRFGGQSTPLTIARNAPEMSTPPAPRDDAMMNQHGQPERLMARLDAVRATEAVVAAAAEAVRIAIAERDAAAAITPAAAASSVRGPAAIDEPVARTSAAPDVALPTFVAPTPLVDVAGGAGAVAAAPVSPVETREPAKAPAITAPPASTTTAPVAAISPVIAEPIAATAPIAADAPIGAPSQVSAPIAQVPALESTLGVAAPGAATPAVVAPLPATPSSVGSASTERPIAAPSADAALSRDEALPDAVMTAVVQAVATALPGDVARALAQPGALSPATIAAIARTVATSPAAAAALRVIELVTRGAAAGAAPDSVGGPRVAMPAGLGGLVVALDTAGAMQRPMASRAAPMTLATRLATAAPTVERAGALPARAPFAPIWASATQASPVTQTSALAAIASERPAAVGHVAWADRWLARFAGASPQALAAFDAVSTGASGRAPSAVYLAPPEFPAARPAITAFPTARVAEAAPERVVAAAPRFADGESVPDDVFAAIFAPQAGRRPAAPSAAIAGATARTALTTTSVDVASFSLVDRLSTAAPASPDAGLFAGLASSPMAPALAPLLALPSAPSFDPRALYADRLAASFLNGVVAPQALSTSAPATLAAAMAPGGPTSLTSPSARRAIGMQAALSTLSTLSSFAALSPLSAMPSPLTAMGLDAPRSTGVLRAAAGAPSAEYVAPEAPVERPRFQSFADAIDNARPLGITGVGSAGAPASTATSAVAASGTAASPALATQLGGAPARGAVPGQVEAGAIATTDLRTEPTAASVAAMISSMPTRELMAIRSTLLAQPQLALSMTGGGEAQAHATHTAAGRAPTDGATPAVWSASTAMASMIDTPLAEAPRGAWNGAPGMTATMAETWSVEQERASADLAFDFLPPELVLAARVYGFGPVEAAQAQRLAVSGASGLAAMATTLDLTFLRAISAHDIQRDQRALAGRADAGPAATVAWAEQGSSETARAMAPITAYPTAQAATAAMTGSAAIHAAPGFAAAPAFSSASTPAGAVAGGPASSGPSVAGLIDASTAGTMAPGERNALFGIARRLPRGAFLWPAATVGAIGLNATAPEGLATLSVAALELLAASAVADLGSWVVGLDSLGRPDAGPRGAASAPSLGELVADGGGLASIDAPTGATAPSAAARATTLAMLTNRPAEATAPTETARHDEPALSDVSRVVASERRARFEAVYLSLSQSSTGRSLSPSSRVARALAILGRDDGSSPATSIERAAEAWSVLPLLLTGGDGQPIATGEIGEAGPRSATAAAVPTEGRPGLQSLSSRAGEALGSFVAPSTAELDTARGGHREREVKEREREVKERERDNRERAREERREQRERDRATRAPAAEFVRTGAPRGRAGGGEVEIPAWFESAARSMLSERTASPSEGISMAELTLINSAPTSHVAASTHGAASSAPASPSGTSGQSASGGGGDKPDVDKLAQKVYSEILKLIDIERERNGEPYR